MPGNMEGLPQSGDNTQKTAEGLGQAQAMGGSPQSEDGQQISDAQLEEVLANDPLLKSLEGGAVDEKNFDSVAGGIMRKHFLEQQIAEDLATPLSEEAKKRIMAKLKAAGAFDEKGE